MEVSCAGCGVLLPPSPDETHFSTFGLPVGMDVSVEQIKESFFQLSRQFHPDFFGDVTTREQTISLERSAGLNDAYRVLGDFYLRMEYLLSLHGRSLDGVDGGWKPPSEMLLQVFELNELLEDIRGARTSGNNDACREGLAELVSVEGWLEGRKAEIESVVLGKDGEWRELDESSQVHADILDFWLEQLARLAYVRNLLKQIATVRLG